MVPLEDLEDQLGEVRFPAVVKRADQFDAQSGEVIRTSAELPGMDQARTITVEANLPQGSTITAFLEPASPNANNRKNLHLQSGSDSVIIRPGQYSLRWAVVVPSGASYGLKITNPASAEWEGEFGPIKGPDGKDDGEMEFGVE